MVGKKSVFTRSINGLGRTVTKHPGKISLVFLFVTILMLQPISAIETQSNMADFMPENEFSRARELMVEEFNNTEGIISIVEAESGNILDKEGLMLLGTLEEEIKGSEIVKPYLVSHKDPVVSIFDAVEGVLFAGSNGTLGIANASTVQLAEAVSFVLSQDEFNQLVSKGENSQRQYSMILVLVDYRMHADDLLKNDETLDLEIENILKDSEPKGYKTYLFGAWSKNIEEDTMEDLSVLLPVTFVVLFLILLVALKSFTDIMISVSGLLVTLIISFGLFSIFGMSFNQLTFFAPIFIMVLSVDFAIHILMRFKEEDQGSGRSKKNMFKAIRFVGISITLSTITTMVAFASNGLSSIPAVASFGIFIAMGIFVSYIVMMTFVPSLKLLSRRIGGRSLKKKTKDSKRTSKRLVSRGLVVTSRTSVSHPLLVLFLVAGITIGGLYMATQLERGMSQEDLISSDSEKLHTQEILTQEFPGKSPDWISIMVEGDVTEPAVLLAMDRTIYNMADDKNIVKSHGEAKAISILSYVKVFGNLGLTLPGVHDVNSDGIPDTKEGVVILYEYLYFNGISDILSPQDIQSVLSYDRVRGTFDYALITVEVQGIDDGTTDVLFSDLKKDTHSLSQIEGIKVHYAGSVFEADNLIQSMTEGMVVSTLVSIIICTVIVVALFRSFKFGLLTSVPVVLITIWILASIFLLGFKLNPVTATTTAMTVGIGIDYSIHFVERYRQERKKGHTLESAMDITTEHTGSALLTAGATTGAGFWIISLSRIGMFHAFGIVAALIVVYVLVASLFVLPAFITLSEKMADKLANSNWFASRRSKKSESANRILE
jgi:predicted RND superfamily exporter protein